MFSRHPVLVTTASAAVAVAALGIAGPASAAPAVSATTYGTSACETYAVQQHVKAWTCVGGVMTTAPAPGSTEPSSVRVAPDTAADLSASAAATASTAAVPITSYCDYSSGPCTTYLSKYIGTTTYVGSYGGEKGGIGSFRFSIRTALNGRQPVWTATWTTLYGPTQYFYDAELQCIQDGNIFGCGTYTVGSGTFTNTGAVAKTITGPRLVQNGTYRAGVKSEFGVAGYDYYFSQPAAYSTSFQCKSNWSPAACRFP